MLEQDTAQRPTEDVQEVWFGGGQQPAQEAEARSTEASMSNLANATESGTSSCDEAAGSPVLKEQTSAILSQMAQSMSQAVESALLNFERRRADEVKTLKEGLRDLNLDQIARGWTEAQQQLAELKRIVSEQQANVTAITERLSQLSSELETARREQTGRADSIEERLTAQESELPSVKNVTDELSGKMNLIVQRVELQTKAVGLVYEVERQRDAALQQLSEIAVGLKASLPPFPEQIADELL